MSDSDRLADYRDYYRSRARRSAANTLYPETAAAQQSMADAADAASSIEDLQATSVELSLAMGHALARDQANARAAVYAETAETVRAQGPAEVLAGVESAADAPALASLLAAIEQRTGIAVTVDELTRLWAMSLTTLENVEMWRTAQVPDRWRAELETYAAEAIAAERDAWAQVETEGRRHQAGWSFDPQVARAERHRRLVPVADAVFERRLAEHGSLVRGGR
ncbi:hypothetical protein [Aeromicrobium ginsengisoli]|uniref:Uncharacterized protein n=1 Tax=Aeromicrobium ginsengisoli TaxID=363867 RepID=A0A5M4FE42_9ACTN|nr:hypothetical protein [Aeromicrobium ginsengisoli]KAA1397522.1 hypothetical protein ESP70_009105 [Aeromicrobium ginsengisoli]